MDKIFTWIKGHPRETVITVASVTLALVVLAVLVPQALGIAVGLALLIWASYTPPAPQAASNGVEEAYTLLFHIFQRLKDAFGIIAPTELSDMYPLGPSLTSKGGVEVIRAEVEKASGAPLTADQFKRRLQKAINSDLLCGRADGISAPSIDGKTPIFSVLDVEENPTAYTVDIVFCNTREKFDAANQLLAKRQRERQAQRHPPQMDFRDEDF